MRKTWKRVLAVVMTAVLTVGGITYTAPAKEVKAATTTITNTDDYYKEVSKSRVSVHDPSIVVASDSGSDGTSTHKYYIFGSHLAWAYSDDLVTWTTFTNNISTNYKTLFAKEFDWAAAGDSVYDPSGNIWAPDIVWNKSLKKWCMYMSINGCSWNSSICMLTADSLDGNWEYKGTVVYSGFTASGTHSYEKTDYTTVVTGDTSLPARYTTDAYTTKDNNTACEATTWNKSYGAHAIDPCVFYDESDQLWFSYGSWSGGIYMFRLDEATGFRDASANYTYSAENKTDPYMGKKIGGSSASGEASYIQYINGKYYLFLSYGGLVANGGYNMRVFSSENPDGPYTDVAGNSALKGGTVNGNIGTRLMSYYKWSFWDNAQVAQGHNSAFVDDAGNAYVIYHTRTNDGTEGHTVRVHQLFTTANGGLVAAPFEYNTTDKVETTYSISEIAGGYEILFQNNTDSDNLEYNEPKNIQLSADGTITGDVTGKWEETAETAELTLTIGGVTYQGTFVEQTMEETNVKTLCFTTVGSNNICLWGAKYPDDATAVSMAQKQISLEKRVSDDIDLPETGIFGTTITWESDSSSILNDGTVILPYADCEVTLTATISKGDYQYKKKCKVTVASQSSVNGEEPTLLTSYYTDSALNLANGTTASVDNPLLGLDISKGVTFKFNVKRTGAYGYLANSNIFGFDTMNSTTDTTTAGRLYFTGGSYLGYNATGGFFDANVNNTLWSTGTDYIGSNKEVEVQIDLTSSGFTVSFDGVEKYSNKTLSSGDTLGSSTLTDYSKVLDWLSGTAKYLNFGFGSWWTGTFKGTLSDFEIWYTPNDKVKTEGGNTYYSEDFEGSTAVSTFWTGQGFSGTPTITASLESSDVDSVGKYIKTAPSGSGNRGAATKITLPDDMTGDYVFETDMMFSTKTSYQETNQFVLLCDDVVYNEKTDSQSAFNAGVKSGYLLCLSAPQNSTTFTINGDSSSTVAIPSTDWVHIKVETSMSNPTSAVLTITDTTTGSTLVENKAITANSTTGKITGIYLRLVRGSTFVCLDNIVVKKPGIADYAAFNTALKLAKKYIAQNKQSPVYSEETITALETAITEAEKLDASLSDTEQARVDAAEKSLSDAIAALVCKEHSYNDGVITKKPTTTAEGVKTFTCYNCGTTKTESVAKLTADSKDDNSSSGNNGGTQGGNNGGAQDGNNSASGDKANNNGNNSSTNGSSNSSANGNNSSASGSQSDDSDSNDSESEISVGMTKTVGNLKYKVLSSKAVSVTGVKKKTLTSVTIGKTVTINGTSFKITQIGNSAFAKCKKLKKVTIGANVTKIGKKAFYKDSKLKKITVKSKKIKSVGSNAFKGIYKKAVIKVPSAKLKAYKKTFKKKGQASSVKIR